MKNESPFGSDADPRIGQALKVHFEGPDPGAFRARLRAGLGRLPERDSEWDVLATWARPRVMAAAMAAGFLLGMAMWRTWRGRVEEPVSPVSVAMFETPLPPEFNPVINAVLEDR